MKKPKAGRPSHGLSETVVPLRCPSVLVEAMKELAAEWGRPASFVWRQAAVEYLKANGIDVTGGSENDPT